jgi:hypothetical protein
MIPAAALAAAIGPFALAGPGGAELFLIDFEGLAESTPVVDQFAGIGVSFSVEGEPDLSPIIALEGNPRVAFAGSGGSDQPMSSGLAGLTDPEVGDDHTVPFDLRMHFDPPADAVRFFFIDLDDGPVTATAFDADGTPLESITRTPADPDAGNGRSTPFSFTSDQISSILIDVADVAPIQYAIDYITFTRPCADGDCGQLIEIAQETEPGAGDFDANILGFVQAFPTTISPIQFYSYGVPEGDSWNGPSLTPEADRSHILFSTGPADLTMFVVHDRAVPNDPDGGEAEMTFVIEDDPNGAFISLRDDPASVEGSPGYLEASPNLIQAGWSWGACCTDGLALSGIDPGATVLAGFEEFDGVAGTAPIEGLTEWVVYSADGTQVPLVLEEGRRLRARVIAPGECPEDITGDGVVGFDDLLRVLSAWGACG